MLATTSATSRAVDELGDQTDAAARDMVKLAGATELAKRQVDDLGDEARGAAADLALLQSRIDASRAAARGLALDFARTDDAGTALQLGRERRRLAQLESAAKLLSPAKGGGLLGGAEALFGGTGGRWGAIAQWAAPIAAMLAPAIGTAVATAMLGGVGTGGLIGGAVLATRDPRVGRAFNQLGRSVLADLDIAAAPFTLELLKVPDEYAAAWRRAQPGVARSLDALAGDVEPIASGLSGLLEHSLPGIERGIGASSKLAHQWAVDMPHLGDAVSDMFDSFAAGAPGAALFFHDAIEGTGKLLVGLGNVSEIASKLYRIPLVGRPPISQGYDFWNQLMALTHGEHPLAPGLTAVGRDLTKPARDDLRSTTQAVQELELEFRRLSDDMVQQRRTTINYKQALADLAQSVKDNGTTIDLNTQKGRDNARGFLDAAEAARGQRDAMIENGVDTQTANLLMASSMKAIEDQAGRNRKAVHDMIAELEAVPAVTTAQLLLQFSVHGLPGEHSGQRLADTVRMAQLPASHQAFIEGLPHRAAGGRVDPGVAYWVGERGPEPFIPDRPGTIYPADSAAAEIDYGRLAAAIVSAFHSSPIQMDGRVVAEQVTRYQAADAYARPNL